MYGSATNMIKRFFDSPVASISTMNNRNLSQYRDMVSSNLLPIERAFTHSPEDIKLIWLFQSLQEMKLSITKYESIFESSLVDDYANIWRALQDEQWIKVEDNRIQASGDGEFYIPLVQSLLSDERISEITAKSVDFQEVA